MRRDPQLAFLGVSSRDCSEIARVKSLTHSAIVLGARASGRTTALIVRFFLFGVCFALLEPVTPSSRVESARERKSFVTGGFGQMLARQGRQEQALDTRACFTHRSGPAPGCYAPLATKFLAHVVSPSVTETGHALVQKCLAPGGLRALPASLRFLIGHCWYLPLDLRFYSLARRARARAADSGEQHTVERFGQW